MRKKGCDLSDYVDLEAWGAEHEREDYFIGRSVAGLFEDVAEACLRKVLKEKDLSLDDMQTLTVIAGIAYDKYSKVMKRGGDKPWYLKWF